MFGCDVWTSTEVYTLGACRWGITETSWLNYNEIPYDPATPHFASCSEFRTELGQGGQF
jgi:hypothetical protein